MNWNPIDLFNRAEAQSEDGGAYLSPGLNFDNPIDTISLGLGLLLGTAGLPHILMRFFTVPDARSARRSVFWAVVLVGSFYVMTTALGFGARALLGEAGATGAVDEAGNLAAPLLAQTVGGGEGTVGGDAFLAIIAAVAFATILAVVAGLVGRGCPRRVVECDSQGARFRRRGGLRRSHRGRRDRRRCDRDRNRRGLRPQRLVHGRARVRRRGERELPRAAPGAHVAPVQHHRGGDRCPVRRRQLDRSGAGRPRRAHQRSADRAHPAGDHLGPAGIHRLLP